jgi:hypothetical protein
MMGNMYYMIWSDAILTAQSKKKNSQEWKILVYLFAVFQMLNLAIVIILIKSFFDIRYPITFQIDIFPVRILNSLLPALLFYILPFVLINYFLIVYKDRYKQVIVNYKSYNGKLVLGYIILSIVSFFLPLLIMKFYNYGKY